MRPNCSSLIPLLAAAPLAGCAVPSRMPAAAASPELAGAFAPAERPCPKQVLALCRANVAVYGGKCAIDPDYRPAAIETRIVPRP